MSDLLKRPDVQRAIEMYALQPDVTAEDVAKELGVSRNLIYIWRKNPKFVDAIYDRYMIKFGGELPAVLQAMIREAKAGNVQAGRLILEHSGKLVKNVNVTIDSLTRSYLKSVKRLNLKSQYAEVEEIVDSIPDINVDLPERKVEDQRKRVVKEKKKIQSAKKIEERKRKRREWYRWNERAKKAGVEPLPARRPTPAQRKAWEQQIIDNEEKKKENK